MRLAVILAVALCGTVAHADAVDDACQDVVIAGPAQVGIRDTNVDATRSICPDPGVHLSNRAYALIATSDFYGTLSGSSFLSYRTNWGSEHLAFLANPRLSVEIGARMVDYRFAQTAVVTATELSIGPLYAGVDLAWDRPLLDRPLVYGITIRSAVPATNTGYRASDVPVSNRVAIAAAWNIAARTHLQLTVSNVHDGAGESHRVGQAASVDAGLGLGRFGVSLGVEAQRGYLSGGLDHILSRFAFRVRAWERYRFELGATVPFAGDERTTTAVVLALSREH